VWNLKKVQNTLVVFLSNLSDLCVFLLLFQPKNQKRYGSDETRFFIGITR